MLGGFPLKKTTKITTAAKDEIPPESCTGTVCILSKYFFNTITDSVFTNVQYNKFFSIKMSF